ncbi:hypothetical protein NicSoilB4_31370 [Arthrobacter sp. NicSoilB4]|nr:hypothetical protein NicSoilB4_31370 [Arthrobacter sp. NicSoilB4]
MTASYRYDVEILHLLVSPAHAYFGRAREGAADVPTTDAERAELVAGKGIVGDRFFGKAAHMDAAVTLIAAEALEAMAAELGVGPFDPLLTRRNVVLRGAQLAPLVGQDFALESGGELVRLRAGRPAPPVPGWTRCSPRVRTPPCAGGAACAASRFRTAPCTAGRRCWSAPCRWTPGKPASPQSCGQPACHSGWRPCDPVCTALRRFRRKAANSREASGEPAGFRRNRRATGRIAPAAPTGLWTRAQAGPPRLEFGYGRFRRF